MVFSPILRTVNIHKRFGGVVALRGVDLTVNNRFITLVIGPNGSGKTTLVNVVSGLLEPDEGSIFFDGREITRLPPHERFRAGLVRTFQTPRLFTSLSVLENVLVPLREYYEERVLELLLSDKWMLREREYLEKAFQILRLLNLDGLWDAPASDLSGGQMKLLELARALMSDPRLVILDEPLAGVNPSLANDIMKHILSIRDKLSVSFLIVEHRLDIALRYTDYVFAMHQGRIIAEGAPDVVIKHPAVVEAYLGG